MASIIQDPGGKKRLQFAIGGGRRVTIRLGKMEMRHADAIRLRVEALYTAKTTGCSPDPETTRWLGGVGDDFYGRLAQAGLVVPRDKTNTTLGGLLDTYFATINVKPGTAVCYRQARRSLEDHFGPNRDLKSITALDAERWRQALKDEGLAEPTISKRIKVARQVFKKGVKWKMALENPFAEVRAGIQTNKSRMHFITEEVAQRVLDACDPEWKVIFALSRYGGLRCPSEHLALRWRDIDWVRNRVTVWSCKTQHHEGREYRVLPLFPELRVHLEALFQQAPDGAGWVITRYRDPSTNMRTQFLRILARAGVQPWEKLFHNLRSTRQTELEETFPTHVVCAWLGNSPTVARGHYLQVRDRHFELAVGEVRATSASGAAQNPTLHAAELGRTEPQRPLGQVA